MTPGEFGDLRGDRRYFLEAAAEKWWELSTTDDDEIDPSFLGAI